MSVDKSVSADELDQLKDIYAASCQGAFAQVLRDRGQIEPLRRMVLVGTLRYADRQKVKEENANVYEVVQKDIVDVESRITGIFIVQESFFYHFLESSEEILGDIVDATANLVERNVILGAKVIHTCGIVNRYFHQWNICVVKTPRYVEPNNQDFKPSENESDVPTLARMLKKLEDLVFVVASFIRFTPTKELDSKINEVLPLGVLPFRAELLELYREKFFPSVQEYVNRYLRGYEYTSYIEEEWPPRGPVQDPREYFEEIQKFEEEVERRLLEEERLKKAKTKPGTFWWTVKTSSK